MTEPSHLTAVRESYDTGAAAYAASVKAPSEPAPLSYAMLTAFAELVQASGGEPVAGLACQPRLRTARSSPT